MRDILFHLLFEKAASVSHRSRLLVLFMQLFSTNRQALSPALFHFRQAVRKLNNMSIFCPYTFTQCRGTICAVTSKGGSHVLFQRQLRSIRPTEEARRRGRQERVHHRHWFGRTYRSLLPGARRANAQVFFGTWQQMDSQAVVIE